jgi:hypothetical protein
MEFVRSEEIRTAATPQQVFALVGDIRRHPEWAYNDLTVEHISGPQVGKGAHYRSVVKNPAPGAKKPAIAMIEVNESHAPELFIYECEDSGGRFRWIFECAVWDDMTLVTHTIERLWSPRWVPLVQPAMWHTFGGKAVREGLAAMKQIAERPPITLPEQRDMSARSQTIELPSEQPSARSS